MTTEHGTASRYVEGCRCADCKQANNDRQQAQRERRVERGKEDPSTIPHGTVGGYSNYCCRCDPCNNARLAWKFGAPIEEIEALRTAHCPICGAVATHLDHDHVTGDLRGFLCSPCNVGLGAFRDDPDRLVAAVLYLERV